MRYTGLMDYIAGQTIRIGNTLYALRNYTEADLEDFADWTIHSDYGFEVSIPMSVYRSKRVAMRNYMHSINAIHDCDIPLYGIKWSVFESRLSKIDILALMLLPTVIIKWHVGDIGLLIAKHEGIVWVEELIGVGNWQSMNEMFEEI